MPEPASLYVYALTPAAVAAGPLGTGIDDAPLIPVPVGRIAAVVHEHTGAPFAGDEATVRRRVLEHADVVERLWSRDRAVLPMTFDVLVAGTGTEPARDRLEAWLRTVETTAQRGLERVAGRVELRVDVGLDRAALADPEVERLRERIRTESPGVARLLRKRLDVREHDAADRLADRVHPAVRAALAACSVELVENPRAAAEPGEVLVLSAALLTDEDAVERVGRALAALQAEQPALRLRFLGPWPPYSFAALRPAEGDRA